MLAAFGYAEESRIRPDDIEIIKVALLHFTSKTNYFNWSSTNEPMLAVDLWSWSKRRRVTGETNRVELLIMGSSRSPTSFSFFVGHNRTVYEHGYGEDGGWTTIQRETLSSLLGKHETDLSVLADESPLFKMAADSSFLSQRTFADKYPTAKGWVDIWLPGISKTRDEAFFCFKFGPSQSPSLAFYKLKREGSNWKITWHTFEYLP